MPDPLGPTDVELSTQIATAALAVPEVARLEPTLRSRLRQASQMQVAGLLQSDGPGWADGVTVRRRTEGTDVTVEFAISAGQGQRPADQVAAEVRTLVDRALVDAGRLPGAVKVAVLAVEPLAAPLTLAKDPLVP